MTPTAPKDATVLVADDDAQSARLLTRILESGGYSRVLTTTDSSAVLDLCSSERPDLLVLDLAMPEPTGFEILERLSELDVPRPSVVVLTGHEHPAIAEKAHRLGASSVVGKTSPREQMLEHFGAALA